MEGGHTSRLSVRFFGTEDEICKFDFGIADDVAAPQPKTENLSWIDQRFKVDLLLVIARPDDETGDIAAYLSRAILDQHRRVAVVCITRGDRAKTRSVMSKAKRSGSNAKSKLAGHWHLWRSVMSGFSTKAIHLRTMF